MADLSPNPTSNAAPGVSTEDVPAMQQPSCSVDRLWAQLWSIAMWPLTILRRVAIGLWTVISHATSRTVTGLCSAAVWLWIRLCRMASRIWAGLRSAAIWMWTMLGNVAAWIWAFLHCIALWLSTLSYLKRLVMIIVLDIFLGSLDISSDIVNGGLLLNGSEWREKSLSCSFKLIIHFLTGFGILLYKLSENKDPEANYEQYEAWGITVLAIVWAPGAAKCCSVARKMEWRGKSVWCQALQVFQLVTLFLIWPVFHICL